MALNFKDNGKEGKKMVKEKYLIKEISNLMGIFNKEWKMDLENSTSSMEIITKVTTKTINFKAKVKISNNIGMYYWKSGANYNG